MKCIDHLLGVFFWSKSVFYNLPSPGTVRYIGPAEFGEGLWVGVELRTPKGKNDGSVQDKRYFSCRPDHGLLVRPNKITVRGINGAKLLSDYNHDSMDLTNGDDTKLI